MRLVIAIPFIVIAGCQASASGTGASVEPTTAAPKKETATPQPPPPPGLSEADAETICTTLRTAECEREERCSPKMLQHDFGDKATCIAREKAACKSVFVLPGTRISNDQAKACAARYASQACDSTESFVECRLPGVIADGGPCLTGNECASGRCAGSSYQRCGKCEPWPKPLGVIGAACKADAECEKWSRCEGGKCAAAGKAKGQKCNQSESCNDLQSLGCFDNTCYEVASVAEGGASCKPDAASKKLPVCKVGTCTQPAFSCVADKKEGEACNDATMCAFPMSCDKATKKCAQPKFDWGVCANRK